MQIYILLTEKCNLCCQMCIRGKQYGKEIDFEQLKILPFVNQISDDTIILTGGEPTLHPCFREIVSFFSLRSKLVVVTTNGTTGYNFNQISDIKNLHIQVSLDGDLEQHDRIRGRGTYYKTYKNLETIDSLGLMYSVATVLNRKNMNSMKFLITELSNLKRMAYWKISYEMPFENGNYNEMLTADEWNKTIDYLINITPFKIKAQKIFPLKLYDAHMEQLLQNVTKRCYNCGGGKEKIYVYPDFNVYSCTCLTDFPTGNLKTESLETILTGKEMQRFTNYEVSNETICHSCKYKGFCNGGCIGMSYHYFGELGRGDIRCPLVQMK